MPGKINIDVKKVAELARLEFKEDELKVFSPQFENILEYISQIDELDLNNVEPMSSPLQSSQRFRDDKHINNGLTRDEVLSNAPKAKDGFFVVPKVIE